MIIEFKADIQSLVSRTGHVEKKMSDFAKSHNALIDSHLALEVVITSLSANVLDLENCSRHHNLRIRGIPENILPDLLHTFLTDLMALILPNCNQLDLTIDCIHRIPKPKNISPHTPRDTIAHIHVFHIKNELLWVIRKASDLPDRIQQLICRHQAT